MRALVKNHNEEVKAHLQQEFGDGNFDECCGVLAPTHMASFRVEEAVQTGRIGIGVGPTEIPPGEYWVERGLEGGCSSHGMILRRYGAFEKSIYIEVGYVGDNGSGDCIDWRGVKKISYGGTQTLILKPNEFTVFDGHKKWSGEEILKFFSFDPAQCKIEAKEFGLHITQEGCDNLILSYGLEIAKSQEVKG